MTIQNLKQISILVLLTSLISSTASHAAAPSRIETINPIKKTSFNNNGKCRKRKQGGNPRTVSGYLVFDGSMDGHRQVDPQIAVGGDHVVHATNNGIIIYDKKGNYVDGVNFNCFNRGIDPKLFYCLHNKIFCFNTWNPWDKAKTKPVNISITETNDPKGIWNIYPVPAPHGRDGGGIGHSTKWIGYSFPGGTERTFVLKMDEAKAGKPATVYHFEGSLGQPAFTQDDNEILYFLAQSRTHFTISAVKDSGDGTPISETISSKPHNLKYIGRPPKSPQKGTGIKTASGDNNPKNLIFHDNCLWFSQTINCNGRAAVQWHQLKLDGTIAQTGLISHPHSNYIQTTLAVNKNNDVLVGFQETNSDMFISPRMVFHKADTPPGTTCKTISLGEGQGATDGVTWGDYSGTTIDGDNLLDLWTIQSITDKNGKGDTIIAKVPFKEKETKKE